MAEPKKLFLLDGMALVYRAHFALISRPIFNSKGVNTSALYGFTQTLLDIIRNQQPTHLAVAFDTDAPTHRHKEYAAYKAERQQMPEDLCLALPHVCRMIEAFRIPVIACDGWEADDVIGTLVQCAEKEDFITYMVTPDKDFGQLVSEKTFLYKPSRMGDGVEVLGVLEILNKWGIQNTRQVIDILGLWGDTSDGIPGVPGIGEKTASKLISQYGSVENILDHLDELKGKLRDSLQLHREQALLSKRLATIVCDAPCETELSALKLRPLDQEKVIELFQEFEFHSIGKRLFGENFKTPVRSGVGTLPSEGKMPGFALVAEPADADAAPPGDAEPLESEALDKPPARDLKDLSQVPHNYHLLTEVREVENLVTDLETQKGFSFSIETNDPDPRQASIVGLSFSWKPHEAWYVHLPSQAESRAQILRLLARPLNNPAIEKVGHGLKADLSVLRWQGLKVCGPFFDSMLAHSLIEPEQRHSLEFLAEQYLSYSPLPINRQAEKKPQQLDLGGERLEDVLSYAGEFADLSWQLREKIEPLLQRFGQEKVYFQIEAPLIAVLVDMEAEGVRIDSAALGEFAAQLAREMAGHEKTIHQQAGREFNVNSPRQLGEVLFDGLKLLEKPKKTKTGQYATDEQTLLTLAGEHEIVRRLLDYRGAAKLKSTYVDALPTAIWPRTGRVHTTYHQASTTTGRLNSQNPNLQNIPIRSEQGREIRKAFVPRDQEHLLLAADYSQIELRILAAISEEKAMLLAFEQNMDIHTATAAGVFGVPPGEVTPEMRRKAKMVNFGIAYGISAFGLSQRLGIPRREAKEIIEQYFRQFPGIQRYMSDTINFAKTHGYVETVTGRRRYIRDILSVNATVRGGAERNAINAPIQGSAADMIKIAMVQIHDEIQRRELKTRMLLQVHDELVFDLFKPEEAEVREVIQTKMKGAMSLKVPIVVDIGVGKNWLEAH